MQQVTREEFDIVSTQHGMYNARAGMTDCYCLDENKEIIGVRYDNNTYYLSEHGMDLLRKLTS